MNQIREYRVRRGATQKDMATEIGISGACLNRIEMGKYHAVGGRSDRTIGLLAEYFSLSLEDARKLAQGVALEGFPGGIRDGHERRELHHDGRIPESGARDETIGGRSPRCVQPDVRELRNQRTDAKSAESEAGCAAEGAAACRARGTFRADGSECAKAESVAKAV